jgi:hypothetical protein
MSIESCGGLQPESIQYKQKQKAQNKRFAEKKESI